MKYVLEVCLIAVALISSQPITAAQTMQKGVSVDMAVTSNAVPVPDADNEGAWIVTVSENGGLYFRTDAVTADGLTEQMRMRPRNRQQKLYIKADARAPFASVERALDAARADLFDSAVLLTSRPEPATPETIVPPYGLEVLLSAPSSVEPVWVQLLNSGQTSSKLKVNHADVSSDALPDTLKQLLQNRAEKVVVVRADGIVPFAQVAHVIEVAHSTGAKVVLSASRL
jgi:biopolymer transport protein ExbD